MGFFSFKKQTKVLEVFDRTSKFNSQEEAEKYYGALRENCLDFIEKVNFKFGNQFDYTPKSLIFLQELYIELEKSDGYKKQFDISKDAFRAAFGIYRMEIYVRHLEAYWSVDRFFESNAYTYGIKMGIVSFRGHVLPDAALGQRLDFYKGISQFLKDK